MKIKYYLPLAAILLFAFSCIVKEKEHEVKSIHLTKQQMSMDKNGNEPSSVDFDGKFLLGSSYYPEQWPEENWEDDFKRMKETGFNVVRMGEFAWTHFEPEPGHFNFDWMDRAIKLAEKYQISVILCTPTAAIPPYLYKQHPEVLSGNKNGEFNFGVRKGYNPNSDELLKASERIVTAMAEHFGNNENIIGWQLDNEPGYPFDLYDNITKLTFRNWLRDKYKSIDNLNQAWYTNFWSQEYTGWDEIELPPLNRADGNANPGQVLDYRIFFSDSFLYFLKQQEQILRKNIGERFIFTNWPNTSWSMDLFHAGNMLDFSGWDNYSPQSGVGNYQLQYEAAMHHDLCRNTNSKQFFIVSEMASQVSANGNPKGIRMKTLQNFAHGAYGTFFFEWKTPLGGAEQGYYSIVEMDGAYGESYPQIKQLGKELPKLAQSLEGSRVESDMALLYSYENQWVQGWWVKDGYDITANRYYSGMKIMKRNIDVISGEEDLSKYRLLVAPGLEIVSDSMAAHLLNYVNSGGILVINKNAGTKNSFNSYREQKATGVFSSVSGISVPWVSPLPQGIKENNFSIVFDKSRKFNVYSSMNKIVLNTATPLASFEGGNLNGMPAVTVNQAGKGFLVYVGTDSESPEFYETIFNVISEKFHFEPIINAPDGVEVVSRTGKENEYIFLLNLTDSKQQITLPVPCKNILTGNIMEGPVLLDGLDVWVLEKKGGK